MTAIVEQAALAARCLREFEADFMPPAVPLVDDEPELNLGDWATHDISGSFGLIVDRVALSAGAVMLCLNVDPDKSIWAMEACFSPATACTLCLKAAVVDNEMCGPCLATWSKDLDDPETWSEREQEEYYSTLAAVGSEEWS